MSKRVLEVAVAGLIAILAGATYAAAAPSPPGGLGERQNRDRVLDSLARQKGGDNNRCSVWNNMGSNQKGVFLTITDLFMGTWLYQPTPEYVYQCVTSDHRGGFQACGTYDPNGSCGGCGCYNPGCFPQQTWTGRYLPRQGYQTEKMLDHVSKIYEMAANNPGCDHDWGTIYDRFWFQADDALLYALRNIDSAAPTGWGRSADIGGAHSPFTQTRETSNGKPRGQTQEFAWDYEAVWYTRGVTTPILDPRLVEIDMDYNFPWHDSNPECYYQGEYGRARYVRAWSRLGYPCVVYSYSPDRPAGPKCSDDSQFFVKQLYRDFLLREADAGGLAFWQGQIDPCNYDDTCMAGKQADVALAFVVSDETRINNPDIWAAAGGAGTASYNHAFVRQLYRGLYRREPDSTSWEDSLNQSGDYVGVTAAFVGSAEYNNRFPTSGAW
jgi:hypothetical protein